MSDSSKTQLGARLSLALVKARRAFFKMSMREKGLLLLFVFALVGLWFSWQLERQRAMQTRIAAARSVSETQELILGYAPSIQEQYDGLIEQIDLDSLPSRDEVTGQIDALVRRLGFESFDLSPARTEVGTDLNFHTIQLVVQRATYGQIKNFTETIKAELPFVSLERIVMQAQARDDQFLDARYVFKSIEYTK